MIKIFKSTTVFILISLAIPVGVFAAPQNLNSAPKPVIVPAVQLVKVVPVHLTQTIIISRPAASLGSSCTMPSGEPGNLIQNAGVINLNQPASCFALTEAQQTAVAALAVVTAQAAATIVVARHIDISQRPSLLPQPAAPSGALPVTVFAAFGILAFEEKKTLRKIFVSLSENLKRVLTVYQLGVLRC